MSLAARAARMCFWAAFALLAYTFALFPALLMLRGRLARRPYISGDHDPSVTIIMALRNEEATVGVKLQNLSALDYPTHRVQIVVASDGSTDDTARIVADQSPHVELLNLPWAGKGAAISAAAAAASGDILVMTDANSVIGARSLRALVQPFADPAVGGVAGEQRYTVSGTEDAAVSGEHAYWRFDRLLKRAGSHAGSAVAATGALYAIRRSLFRPIPPGVNDDYYLSAGVVLQGYRLVLEPRAVVFEPAAVDLRREFKRKVRLMTRAFRTEWELRSLANPTRYGFFALQFASQKVLRRAACVPLVVLLASSLVAAPESRLLRWVGVSQVTFYTVGFAGWLVPDRFSPAATRAIAIPAYFTMSATAASIALWNTVRGRRVDRWEPERAPA